MKNDLFLKFSEEARRQTAVWNKIIEIIKEIHFAKYKQKEIRQIIDEIVWTAWQQDKERNE